MLLPASLSLHCSEPFASPVEQSLVCNRLNNFFFAKVKDSTIAQHPCSAGGLLDKVASIKVEQATNSKRFKFPRSHFLTPILNNHYKLIVANCQGFFTDVLTAGNSQKKFSKKSMNTAVASHPAPLAPTPLYTGQTGYFAAGRLIFKKPPPNLEAPIRYLK